MPGFRYRTMRPDIARDLKSLLENCIFASEVEKGRIDERYAATRLVGMLEDDYPEHRGAVLNRDVLYEICKQAVSEHIDRTTDPVHLRSDLNGQVPDDVREAIENAGRVRRFFRVKDPIKGGYTIKRREQLDVDDWEQIREQRHQTEREVGRWGDYADLLIEIGKALKLEGPIGQQVFALSGAEDR